MDNDPRRLDDGFCKRGPLISPGNLTEIFPGGGSWRASTFEQLLSCLEKIPDITLFKEREGCLEVSFFNNACLTSKCSTT